MSTTSTKSTLVTADDVVTSEARRRVCAHCGLPVPAMLDADVDQAFCCRGCQAAYRLIHEHGLEGYYGIRADSDSSPNRPLVEVDTFEQFDDPTFQALHTAQEQDGSRSISLFIDGMHCAACVWLLERLPAMIPGLLSARADFGRSSLHISWRPDRQPLSAIATTLSQLGYQPHPWRLDENESRHQRENRRQLARIAVAGACAGNNMLIALAIYAGDWTGMEVEHTQYFRAASALLGIVSLVWPGSVFFRGAWASIRSGVAHLDLPLALGLAVGGLASVHHTLIGEGDIYFDTLSILVFLLLVGRYIQYRQQRRAADRLQLLRSFTPRSARRVDADRVRKIPMEALNVGDHIEVRVGETIPADGRIVGGDSSIDESLLTGESAARAVSLGAEVTAGSGNLGAVIRIEVSRVGMECRVGQLARMAEEAASVHAPVHSWAHRYSGYFVTAVIILSLITIAAWWPASPGDAVEHAVALLIVTCPCALGLATPLALAVAQSRAARQSIVLKGSECLERLAPPGTIWLDKTGTLTEGRMWIRRWLGRTDIAAELLALEGMANHPLARGIVESLAAGADHEDRSLLEVRGFRQHSGAGVSAMIDNVHWRVGSESFIRATAKGAAAEMDDWREVILAEGLTLVLVERNGLIVSALGLGDELRSHARQIVEEIRHRGWRVGILSGDQNRTVQQIAARVGIKESDALGELSPEDKVRLVEPAHQGESTIMVGDGLNDGAALAAATVGVAVHGGAEVSLKAAPVYLARPGLDSLLMLLDGARRTQRVIQRNIVASIGYNVFAAGLAMAGYVHPLLAAVLMPFSSLTVIGLSLANPAFAKEQVRSVP